MAIQPRFNHYMLSIATAGFLIVIGNSGCAHFVETRTIEKFMTALESGDLNDLRLQSTDNFEEKALRLDESVSDLRRLKLPEGEIEIVSVNEITETEKEVTVAVGPRNRRLKYRIKRDPELGKWVVDDIYMKQQRSGLAAAKSVTEQMDLLLSVREFVAVWEEGYRADVLATVTPDLAKVLSHMPPTFLARVTRDTVGKRIRTSQPKAQLDDDAAVVQLPRVGGQLVLAFRRVGPRWRVADVRVESRSEKERVESVRELAKIMNTTVAFLDAFAISDKQSLQALCSETFFRGSLEPSDLSRVRLPDSYLRDEEYDVDIRGERAYFKVKGDTEWVTIALVQVKSNDEEVPTMYDIEDVTIYDMQSGQQKKLSAMFTAHAVLRIFSEALVDLDLDKLRFSSTPDMNQKIWNRIDRQMLTRLPLAEIERANPKILTTVFQGSVTEVTVTQGSRALTYVLVDRNGGLRVDDVLLPVQNRPNSLKQTLELAIPVAHFARGIETNKINLVRFASSKDFNRLVWQQFGDVPEMTSAIPRFTTLPIRKIRESNDKTIVEMSDDVSATQVTLVRENSRFTIDDIKVIPRRDRLESPASLRTALRKHLARVGTVSSSKRHPPIEQRAAVNSARNYPNSRIQ